VPWAVAEGGAAVIPGDRVRCTARWSSFFGRGGRVTHVEPLWVLFDGEGFPMCVSESEVTPDTLRRIRIEAAIDSSMHLAGAE
jgi:hypothetical protein